MTSKSPGGNLLTKTSEKILRSLISLSDKTPSGRRSSSISLDALFTVHENPRGNHHLTQHLPSSYECPTSLDVSSATNGERYAVIINPTATTTESRHETDIKIATRSHCSSSSSSKASKG